MKRCLLLLVSMAFCFTLAQASIIVDFTGVSSAAPANPGDFIYAYTAALQPGEELDPADNSTFFTIYDFNGFLSVIALPQYWGFSASLLGPNPPGTSQPDNPDIINLEFYYTGPVMSSSEVLDFSGFQILDSTNSTQLGFYAAEATKDSGDQIGTEDSNLGSTTVPGSPEPASLILIGSGLVALAFARKRLMR